MNEEIEKAAEVVRSGGVILYPTDTVWGLGCDPKNDEAIKRIMTIKQRDEQKNLIVIVPSIRILERYAKVIPDICYDLIEYADKPLTIVYPEGQYLSPLIPAEDGSVGIRITKNEFCIALMNKLKMGLVSTSANLSGEPAAVSLSEVPESLRSSVDYIVNLPENEGTFTPSQVIKVSSNGEFQILRQ